MPRIPKQLHYVFGMSPSFGGKPWSLMHYVCLRSAVDQIQPDRVIFHYTHEPTGPWWKLSRPFVSMRKAEAPISVFDNSIDQVAHTLNVLRFQALIQEGGIYLDADVFVQRSFDDLLGNSTVLGREGSGNDSGLPNAIILAEPGAPFLVRWFEAYRRLDHEHWREHSAKLSTGLMAEYPDEVTTLPPRAFFWPPDQAHDIDCLFASAVPIPLQDAYAHHLRESQCWPLVKDLTPGDVRRRLGNFQRWAEPLVAGLPNEYGAPGRLALAGRQGRARLRTLRENWLR